MPFRLLIDENIDPLTADRLQDRGHDAITVEEELGKGTEDSSIQQYAREHDRLLLTNDTDFLRAKRREGLRVLYVPENTMRAHEIAGLVDALAGLVPDQTDLPEVTWLTDASSI